MCVKSGSFSKLSFLIGKRHLLPYLFSGYEEHFFALLLVPTLLSPPREPFRRPKGKERQRKCLYFYLIKASTGDLSLFFLFPLYCSAHQFQQCFTKQPEQAVISLRYLVVLEIPSDQSTTLYLVCSHSLKGKKEKKKKQSSLCFFPLPSGVNFSLGWLASCSTLLIGQKAH